MGMKVGEKKTIEVSPEEGYGTGPTLQTIPLHNIAPVFTIEQDKKVLADVVTQVVQKTDVPEDMRSAKVGQTLTGADGATGKVKAVTDSTLTIDIQNIKSPFYKKPLKVGLTSEME